MAVVEFCVCCFLSFDRMYKRVRAYVYAASRSARAVSPIPVMYIYDSARATTSVRWFIGADYSFVSSTCRVIMQMSKGLEVFIIIIILLYVCVHTLLAQTIPYISFKGQTLANHSYVDLSLVGSDASGNDSVQCITDLEACCSSAQGPHRGDWYFPDGTRLLFSGAFFLEHIYESRGIEKVDLRRKNQYNVPGIYRCNISTNAVHNVADTSLGEMVYVGLYHSGGEQ